VRRRTSPLVAVALALLAAAPAARAADPPFPRDFAWGVASAGFQGEMGGRPDNRDTRTDWWAWTHDAANISAGRVSGDLPERGPGSWRLYARDIALARGLGAKVFRMGIEWSRIFPRSTAAVATRDLRRVADAGAVRHYRAVLREVRRQGLRPFVTLSHFALPSWVHDPIAARDALARVGPDDPLPSWGRPRGWLDRSTVREFAKYAAFAGATFGDLVDDWTPLNEPFVVAASGYVNVPGAFAGFFPPGALSYAAAIAVVRNEVDANAAAYDALKRTDRGARVGLVHNMIAFTPADPSSALDRAGARHADRVFNRLWLDATVRGLVDEDADGRIEPGERHPELHGKADFVGVNYYFRGRVTGLGAPLSRRIGLLDFVPSVDYRTPEKPASPPCPTECSAFGNELHPDGLRDVLRTAGSYGRPVYITEAGIADAGDAQRRRYLRAHLRVLRRAMADGVARVRGWFHWSLIDNFEWAAGYQPRFGLYAFDPRTLARRARPSAALLRGVFTTGRVPSG